MYIGVKVTNAGDYTSTPTLELKAPNGSTVSSTTVSGYNGYYEITNDGKFVLTVTGTNNDGTRSKTQPIVISCMDVLPGSTILRSQAPKITVKGLKYADIDRDGKKPPYIDYNTVSEDDIAKEWADFDKRLHVINFVLMYNKLCHISFPPAVKP